MLHDEKLWRLTDLLESDVVRMLEGQASKVAGFDQVDFDPLHGLISYLRENQRIWTAQVEALGTYAPDVNVFRWAWSSYDRPVGKSRLVVVFAEGQRLGIPSMTTGQTPVADEEHAIRLANTAAAMARASGVYRTREPQRLTFFALFEPPAGTEERLLHTPLPPSARLGGSRFPPPAMRPPSQPPGFRSGESVYPAPGVPMHAPPPARTPIMSMLPPSAGAEPGIPVSRDRWIDPSDPPATRPEPPDEPARPVREPSRGLIMPIANITLTAVVSAMPQGFHQALLVVDVTVAEAKARFSAVVVATDANGELKAIPTPQSVMDGVGLLIVEDVKSGNGRWSRLLVRLSQKENRVTLQVHVSA